MRRLLAGVLVAVLFTTVVGLTLPVTAQVTLKDITGHEFEFEIKKLVELGVIKGFPDGTFRPDALLTRAEAAVILVNLKKLPLEKPAVSPFKDVPPTHWAYRHIVAVQKAGFMKGYPDGTFKPGANILRAEMAAMLGQVKGLAKEAVGITEMIAFATDEANVPKWAVGWITLGYYPQHQYLTYRTNRTISANLPATRGEMSYGAYMVYNPPRIGGMVKSAQWQEPVALNPWFGMGLGAMWYIIGSTHAFGVKVDDTGAIFPELMREIPTVENGQLKLLDKRMEIVYRIRQNIKFSDGTPATTDDWAYNFMVFMDPVTPVTRYLEVKIDTDRGTGAYGIKGFDILDKYSIKVYYKESDYRAAIDIPAGGTFYPKAVLEPAYKKMKATGVVDHLTKDELVIRRPIQLGAYRVVDWKPSTHVLVERNPYYFFGYPPIDRIIFEFVPDTTVLLSRIIAGAVDVTPDFPGITLDQALTLDEAYIKAHERTGKTWHTRVIFGKRLTTEQIIFNCENPITGDLRIRKAIAYAIDREKIIRELLRDKERIAHTYIPYGHWAWTDNVIKYPYDPATARRLLDEAGWRVGSDGIRVKDGVRLVLELRTTAGHRLRESTQAVMKSMLREVGIDLDIGRNVPVGVLLTQLPRREWPHLAMLGWGPSILGVLEERFRADSIPTAENGWVGMNWGAWRNLEVTRLYDEVAREMSEPKRKVLMEKIQYIMSEELPILPIRYWSAPATAKVNLANYKVGLTWYTAWNAYQWYWR